MTTQVSCPTCGTLMREIVWGYGTIADVADAGEVVIGGCVIDVDDVGRVAALQCPACGTRADEHGIALEKPTPETTEHPFGVAFSSAQHPRQEATMREQAEAGDDAGQQQDTRTSVQDDFDGIASGSDWREQIEPYTSRDDEVPQAAAPSPERVEPYSSREDALPERDGEWRERIDPFAADPGSQGMPGEPMPGDAAAAEAVPGAAVPGAAVPGEVVPGAAVPRDLTDAHYLDTSSFTDAEEEGWPARGPE